MYRCKQCRHARKGETWDKRFCQLREQSVQAEELACAEGFQISARAFLESISRADKRLEEMSFRAQRYRDMAKRATGSIEATRVSGTAGRSQVESNINRCIDIANDIDRQAAQLRERYAQAMRAIEGVSDPAGREVLELRYLHRMRWEEIAKRIGYTQRNIIRLHGIALREVEAQIDQDEREQNSGQG